MLDRQLRICRTPTSLSSPRPLYPRQFLGHSSSLTRTAERRCTGSPAVIREAHRSGIVCSQSIGKELIQRNATGMPSHSASHRVFLGSHLFERSLENSFLPPSLNFSGIVVQFFSLRLTIPSRNRDEKDSISSCVLACHGFSLRFKQQQTCTDKSSPGYCIEAD